MNWELIALATLATGFGSVALVLGHDGAVIASVFAFLGTIGGYIVGKAKK